MGTWPTFPLYHVEVDPSRWRIVPQARFEPSLLLFITGECNLRCVNCFSSSARNPETLPVPQVKQLLDANPSFERIDIMGGEPLLHRELAALFAVLEAYGKRATLYSNGLLLDHLPPDYGPYRVCVSFHEIDSNKPSRKPLASVLPQLARFADLAGNQLKLVLLLDRLNSGNALEMIQYVDRHLPFVNRLTLGLVRRETAYWNDLAPGVLSFREYFATVQEILHVYQGRLDLDIFTKGVLRFPQDPGALPNRVNRFKCVFQDLTYADCLFSACEATHQPLEPSLRLPEHRDSCKHTGDARCLADKVRLRRPSDWQHASHD